MNCFTLFWQIPPLPSTRRDDDVRKSNFSLFPSSSSSLTTRKEINKTFYFRFPLFLKRIQKSSKTYTKIGKRKRHDEDDDGLETTEPEDAPQDLGEGDAGDADMDGKGRDYHTPKPKTAPRKQKSKISAKAKGPPPPKKPRVAKSTGSKPAKTTVRKGRKPKEGDDTYDAAQVAKDTKIAADNPLFSTFLTHLPIHYSFLTTDSTKDAVMNPAAALQSTAEDFLESLEQTPGAAQAELINLILRSCGCNDSVDADEVLDYDGVVDALDTFTEGLKQVSTAKTLLKITSPTITTRTTLLHIP